MGEFRKYRPYYACNALRFNGYPYYDESNNSRNNARTRVPNFKDIAGVEYGWLKNFNSSRVNYSNITSTQTTISGISGQSITMCRAISNNYQSFIDLTPFATTDKLADYDIDDYDYRPNMVGVTYFQTAKYVATDVNKILYSMSIFNDNVDSYAANDDPVFVDDTFYSLVDGNYILLTEIPSDWSTNYTGYYKLVPAEDIKVSCIKFRTYLATDSDAGRGYSAAVARENNSLTQVFALLCAYFLDEEITIHPGDSYLLSLSFESSQF